MKHKINYRLAKYHQTFFNTQKYKTSDYKRYKHRLIAWYLLHEYNLHYALVHLSKYTDILRVLKNEFKEYKSEIETLYQIDLSGKYKSNFKHLIQECKICKVCGNRVMTNSEYCSQSCANSGKDNSKVSYGLKKYYKTTDCTERHNKMRKTLNKMYNKMTPEEIKSKCTNYYNSNHNYRTFTNPKRIQLELHKLHINVIFSNDYAGHNSMLTCRCELHNCCFKMKYSDIKNKNVICPECINDIKRNVLQSRINKAVDLVNNGKNQNISFVKFIGTDKIIMKCKKHGNYITSTRNLVSFNTGCPKCSNNSSKAEIELMKLFGGYKTKQVIYPLELDVYIPEYKTAIEYNGLMWHSFGKSRHSMFNNYSSEKEQKNKHLSKTDMCEAKGIQLYHIFENEWLNPVKKEIWKSVIKSKLGKTERIYGRKCSVKEISSKEAKDFLNENHLQGYTPAKISIGLFYDSEIVQVMSFSKPRMSKQYQYEIIRMCNSLNKTVIGGASKLLKYFERTYKPESIVSYANRRWSIGNVYHKLGFELSHISGPNYFYFQSDNILWSRNKFQKHKLKDILPIFNAELTETINMYNNNYRKIYDCGNLVYVKQYQI